VPQTAATEKPASDWVTITDASERLGFSRELIALLIREGVMPSIKLAGTAGRTTHRIPRRLVEDACAAVMSGGQVELRDFCSRWSGGTPSRGWGVR
jgi:excisionase family DNA binding protein